MSGRALMGIVGALMWPAISVSSSRCGPRSMLAQFPGERCDQLVRDAIAAGMGRTLRFDAALAFAGLVPTVVYLGDRLGAGPRPPCSPPRTNPSGRAGSPAAPPPPASLVRVFVLGIDPGLSRCGYCVLDAGAATSGRPARGPEARAVALGVVRTAPDREVHLRLAELQQELRALLCEYRPSVLAVERVLFQVNVRTAMSVGQASGIAMAEAVAAGCDVVQYSPNEVKSAVAGWGGAAKEQVQQMVQTLLGLPRPPHPPDAADAAALALCHLAMAPVRGATRRAESRTAPGVRA